MTKSRLRTQQNIELAGALLAAVACSLPAAFLGIVLSGNLGGAYIGWAADALSWPPAPFVILGIIVGFSLVFLPIVAVAALGGRLLARAAWRHFRHDV
jgi:hypothetical protein